MSDKPANGPVNKPLLIALGAVAALAALFFLVVNPLLLSDDAADDAGAVATQPQVDEAAASVSPAPEVTELDPEAVAPEAFEIYNVRDPFEQLVQVVPTPTDGTSPAPTEGTTATTSATTTPQAGAQSSADASATAQGTVGTVALRDVTIGSDGTQLAQVLVDGQGIEVGEGDVVAGDLQLVALAEPCGTFLMGASQFTLCEGQEVRP